MILRRSLNIAKLTSSKMEMMVTVSVTKLLGGLSEWICCLPWDKIKQQGRPRFGEEVSFHWALGVMRLEAGGGAK